MGWAWKARQQELEAENAALRAKIEKLEAVKVQPPTYCVNCGHVCLNPSRPLLNSDGNPLRPII